MSMPIAPLLATAAILAILCSLAGTPGVARADDMNAAQPAPLELSPWRSVLTDTGDAPGNPDWKSTLSTADLDSADLDPAESRVVQDALGLRHVTQYGFRFSPDSFGAPEAAR